MPPALRARISTCSRLRRVPATALAAASAQGYSGLLLASALAGLGFKPMDASRAVACELRNIIGSIGTHLAKVSHESL